MVNNVVFFVSGRFFFKRIPKPITTYITIDWIITSSFPNFNLIKFVVLLHTNLYLHGLYLILTSQLCTHGIRSNKYIKAQNSFGKWCKCYPNALLQLWKIFLKQIKSKKLVFTNVQKFIRYLKFNFNLDRVTSATMWFFFSLII